MPGYRVRDIEHSIGGRAYRLRVPGDIQQSADPDGHRARAGISSARWSPFGFPVRSERVPANEGDPPPHRGRMLHYRRDLCE